MAALPHCVIALRARVCSFDLREIQFAWKLKTVGYFLRSSANTVGSNSEVHIALSLFNTSFGPNSWPYFNPWGKIRKYWIISILESPTTPQWLPESSDIISTMVLCCDGPINSNWRPRTNKFNFGQPDHGSEMGPCETSASLRRLVPESPKPCETIQNHILGDLDGMGTLGTTFLDDFVHGNRPKIKKNWGITFWSKKSWSLIQVVARKQYISTVAANWIGVFHFGNKFRPIIWGFSSGIKIRPAKRSVKKRQSYIAQKRHKQHASA